MASLILRSGFALLLLLPGALAQELPKRDASEIFDFEPKLMLNDLPDLPLPVSAGDSPAIVSSAEVARLETDLERAKKTAAWRMRLWKAGVLSKVEAEQSALRIVRLASDLGKARLQVAAQDVEDRRKRVAARELSAASLTAAETALAAATAAAREAAQKWEEAQRTAAETRVQRERKLLALGAGSRSAVKRAEAALQSLATPVSP
jgi:hypothetical protein